MTPTETGLQAFLQDPSADERARLALEAGRMVSWQWEIETDAVKADPGLFALFGLDPGPLTAQAIFARMHPEDLPTVQREVDAALAAGVDYRTEFRVRQRNGSYRWIGASGAVTARAADGSPLRMLGVNWDKTDQKLQEERLSMMADEMNHRVKNAFAIMNALVLIGSRTTDTKDRFAERLRAQVQALASAHSLTVEAARRPDEDTVIPVARIIEAALTAWTAPGPDAQVTCAFRADLSVANRQSAALSMLTYELATNAVKYGALSSEAGHLTVTLNETEEGGMMRWVERCAVPLPRSAPDPDEAGEAGGFGSVLVTHSEQMLRGRIVRRLTPTGLHVEAFFPVVRAAASEVCFPDAAQRQAG